MAHGGTRFDCRIVLVRLLVHAALLHPFSINNCTQTPDTSSYVVPLGSVTRHGVHAPLRHNMTTDACWLLWGGRGVEQSCEAASSQQSPGRHVGVPFTRHLR